MSRYSNEKWVKGWHFSDDTEAYTGDPMPPIGKIVTLPHRRVNGKWRGPQLCHYGYHASPTIKAAHSYAGGRKWLCRVQIRGKVQHSKCGARKFVGLEKRVLWAVNWPALVDATIKSDLAKSIRSLYFKGGANLPNYMVIIAGSYDTVAAREGHYWWQHVRIRSDAGALLVEDPMWARGVVDSGIGRLRARDDAERARVERDAFSFVCDTSNGWSRSFPRFHEGISEARLQSLARRNKVFDTSGGE